MMLTTLISRGRVCHGVLMYIHLSVLNNSYDSILCIFEHVQWRRTRDGGLAHCRRGCTGYSERS